MLQLDNRNACEHLADAYFFRNLSGQHEEWMHAYNPQ